VSGTLTFTYTPEAGFVGTDSFTFKGNDGEVDSNTATYTINVIAPPVAVDDSFSAPYATSISIAAPGVRANDSINPALYSTLSAAQNVSVGNGHA
jgi:hypothetical protein